MKNSFRLIQFLFIACLTLTTTAFADVKIKSRQSAQGQSYESTTYIKGKRQRSEQNIGGYQTVNITQCDLRRSLQIMPQNKVYLVTVFDETAAGDSAKIENQKSKTQSGGVITTTVTNKDTGERKQGSVTRRGAF